MEIDLQTDYGRNKAQAYLAKLIERKAFIELKEVRSARSSQQNKYLHAMITEYAIEYGHSIDEAKNEIKARLGYTYMKNGVQQYHRTSKMDTQQLSMFTEKFRDLSAKDGLYLMSPEEYTQGGWKECRIRKQQNQQYL